MADESVVHVVPDKMGGVISNIAAMLGRFSRERFSHRAVLVHHHLGRDTRFGRDMSADDQITVEHCLPLENLHSVLRRLDRAIPPGGGVLVANDWLELALLSRHPSPRAVFQVLHGDFDYYFDLALKHEAIVDLFIACSERVAEKLRLLLPERSDSIHRVPYGVVLPAKARRPAVRELKLLYAGRLEEGQKRVFDLPLIAAEIEKRGLTVSWTVVGGGPDEDALRRRWSSGRVSWRGVLTPLETQELMAEHDALILPSRAEGLPVSILEAMSVGLVPIVTDLESGVPEVVTPGRTGFRLPLGDVGAFASAVTAIDRDRALLERMSAAAREIIRERFQLSHQIARYEDLFARWRELRRSKPPRPRLHYGSRLDQPWIPNVIVRLARGLRKSVS
jgi:glycosyltransferase involved in cell wall biosynthesis